MLKKTLIEKEELHLCDTSTGRYLGFISPDKAVKLGLELDSSIRIIHGDQIQDYIQEVGIKLPKRERTPATC